MIEKIKLLNIEINPVLYVQSISTITFYEGCCPNNYIIEKINKIIILNPWLNGKLIKLDNEIFLEYNNENNNINRIYNYIEDDEKLSDLFINYYNITNYNNLMNKISSLLVKSGIECLNKDEKLFKVILIKMKSKFALLISINHCIADGYTYYKIYSMFSHKNKEEKMIIKRLYNFDNIIKINKNKWSSIIGKKIYNFINFLIKKQNNLLDLYIIDKNKINKIKQQYIDKNIMISINDIITSEFLNKSNTLIGLMNFNYRNVNINKYKLYAGNYVDTIYFTKQKYIPYNIRNALNLFKLNINDNMETTNYVSTNYIYDYIKNIYNDIINIKNIFDISCISSWYSLYNELYINNSHQIAHIPCITNLNSSIYFNKFCVVFHYMDNKIGILSNTDELNF